MLNAAELGHILECVRIANGVRFGYSDNKAVAQIQAKLSMMLQYEQEQHPQAEIAFIPILGPKT